MAFTVYVYCILTWYYVQPKTVVILLIPSGESYWRYNETSKEMDKGYPQSMNSWRGIPSPIDSVLRYKDGKWTQWHETWFEMTQTNFWFYLLQSSGKELLAETCSLWRDVIWWKSHQLQGLANVMPYTFRHWCVQARLIRNTGNTSVFCIKPCSKIVESLFQDDYPKFFPECRSFLTVSA